MVKNYPKDINYENIMVVSLKLSLIYKKKQKNVVHFWVLQFIKKKKTKF